MKRCPECRRDYYDDSLSYCLDDGTPLLEGPGSGSAEILEPSTAIMPTMEPDDVSSTKVLRQPSSPDGQTGRHRNRPWAKYVLICAGVFLIAAAGVYAVYRWAPSSPAQQFQNIKLTRITTEGAVESATISPDGKYIAYTLEESGKRSLWTKNLTSNSRVQITPAAETLSLIAGTFSPDGSYVYYTRVDDQNPKGAMYIVPVLGGDSKKIAANVSQPVSIAPDGKHIAYGRYHLNGPQDEIYIANADGSSEELQLTVKEPDFLMGSALAWSPDGKALAFAYGGQIKDTDPAQHRYDMRASILSLNDKTLKTVSKQGWAHVGSFAWPREGAVVFVAVETSMSAPQVWQCDIKSGESRRISNDLNSYDLLSLSTTSDGRALVAVQSEPVSQLWISPAGDTTHAHPLLTRKNVQDGRGDLSWTPDGKLIFDSSDGSGTAIWSIYADGSDAKALTASDARAFIPEVSPDGRTIFFGSTKIGFQLWRMNADSSDPRQLTNFEGAPTFSVTPDGKWLIFNPYLGGLYKIPTDGGEPTRIVPSGGLVYPQVSPDGKLLAYFTQSDDTKRPKIVVLNFEDASPMTSFDVPISGAPPHLDSLTYHGFHWSVDGKALVYINTIGGVSNLWSQPLDGRPAKQITDFKTDKIYSFAYSRDGKTVAFARGSNSPDAVLIADQR